MMKKMLALLLSVIMAASLTVPAFADGPDGPAPDGYQEAVPISAFLPSLTPDEALGIIGGADGPTAIITIPSLEDFQWDGYDLERLYPDGVDWEQLDQLMQQHEQQLIDNTKEALGGVPGQIGVMVNGAYIQFPGAAPEIVDGTTMAPVRALVEALGGEVSTYGSDVRCKLDGMTIIFTIGSKEAVVELDADADEGCEQVAGVLEMDCAPYIKGGRTYVPVRFLAGALGYEVGWDGAFQTVILLDREAMAAKFDEKFTILNRVQANRAPALKEGESWSAGVKGSVTVTAFDTLNGDTTYQADFTEKTLRNAEAVSGSYSLKLSGSIADLLIGQYEGQEDEEVLERMRLLLDAVEDADVIMTREGLMWVHSAALDELGGEENIWCGMLLDEGEVQRTFAGMDASTVGTALAAMISTDSVMDYSSTVGASAQMLYVLFGDDQFTTSGGVSTRTIGLDDLEALYPYGGMDEYEEFEMSLKVDRDGGAAVTCTMETNAQYGSPAMRLTMDCTQSSGKTSLTMTLHAANLGEMELTLTTTQAASSGQPMTEPPAGATVVDAPALLDGYGGFNSAE